MDMVVFDCEDDEESRPTATGGGAFNFGCLDAVDCILYFFVATVLFQGEEDLLWECDYLDFDGEEIINGI
jgi:hypothetical protein